MRIKVDKKNLIAIDIGSVTSLSDLQTGFINAVAQIVNNASVFVRFACTSSFAPFSGATVKAIINKVESCYFDAFCMTYGSNGLVHAKYTNGTWTWENLAKRPKSLEIYKTVSSGVVVCYNSEILTPASCCVWFQPMYLSSLGVQSYFYTLQHQSSGQVNIYVRKPDGTNPADGTYIYGNLFILES